MMTFYFYDVETSGFRARSDRIMQFAGQRTDMDLKPMGKPDNILIKMTPDVLPEPGAILVHGITPQRTLIEGISEAEFCKFWVEQVSIKDTIIVGYNNIRFDNEFIRFTLWRNFHDPYEWSWKDGCSTWDLLDVVRMTRALRPTGINWPFAPDGQPSNRLEHISSVNKLDHVDAHDAMSDVTASLAVARLLKNKQPKLFDYLLNIRGKNKVAPLVTKGDPLIYTSGRYPSEFEKTTAVVMVVEKPDKTGVLVYDLRIDPDEFKDMPVAELASRWNDRAKDAPYFPVKELKYNRCPALAPLSVLDDASAKRLRLDEELLDNHLKKLRAAKGFGERLLETLEAMWPRQPQLITDAQTVDGQLYEEFIKDKDRPKMSATRAADANEISVLDLDFKDERLKVLLPLYRARNFPGSLSSDQKNEWENFRHQKLLAGGNNSLAERFYSQLEELKRTSGIDSDRQMLLEELEHYARSILPQPIS